MSVIYREWGVDKLTKLSVDSSDQFIDHSAQVLVLFDVLPTGYSNLYEDNLAHPLWVVAEEHLERMQLLRHTLDVIETVDANHKLHTLELLLQHGDALLHLLLLEPLRELLGVNANGERATCDDLALEFDTIRGSGKTPGIIGLAG